MRRTLNDVRLAARSLRRSPAFSVIAVVCLAVGAGATSTAFRVLDALLLRVPAVVDDPDCIARVYFHGRSTNFVMGRSAGTSYPVYTDIHAGVRSFDGVAAWWELDVSLGRGVGARGARAAFVSDTYFPVLRVPAALGQLFSAADPVLDASPSVILSHDAWLRLFAGKPDAIGAGLIVNGRTFTIVGVAPRGFHGLDVTPVDVWLPLKMASQFRVDQATFEDRDARWLRVIARLRPGVSDDAAAAEVAALMNYTRDEPAGELLAVSLGPLNEGLGAHRAPSATVAFWVTGVTAFLLLITCANVAALSLTRAVARRRAVAVRLALGARPSDVARYALTESLLIAVVAAAAGACIAAAAGGLVRSLGIAVSPAADLRLFAGAFGIAALTFVAFGTGPALYAANTDASAVLRPALSAPVPRANRFHYGLFVGQVALTFTLLAGAVLFVRAFRTTTRVDLGIDIERVLVAYVADTERQFPPQEWDALVTTMRDRAAALPFVRSAGLAIIPPFRGLVAVAVDPGSGGRPGIAVFHSVDSAYFKTIGRRLIRGRSFNIEDHATAPTVAVVDETMARQYWPGSDALGACFHFSNARSDDECATIVGIVSGGKYSTLAEDPTPAFFVPLTQRGPGTAHVVLLRVTGDPSSLARTVQQELQGISDEMPYVRVESAASLVEPQVRPWRIGAAMFSLLGALALGLSALSVYGMASMLTAQRLREIGIRLALGSPKRRVVGLVVRRVAVLAAAGLCFGAVLAVVGARKLAPALPGLVAYDPVDFALVSVILGIGNYSGPGQGGLIRTAVA